MEKCNCIKEDVLSELRTLSKRNKQDIEKLTKKSEGINGLSNEMAKLSEGMKHMNENLNELKSDVKELKSEKGKWYDKVKWFVVSMLVGSMVTLYLTQILGGN